MSMVATSVGLNNRFEIVFVYDVRDANPNGDPDNENRPRLDDKTGENLVTDVRLKRTIRDFWLAKGLPVLIRAETTSDGLRKSMEDLAADFLISKGVKKGEKTFPPTARTTLANELPKSFQDVRTFGATVTVPGANYAHTGAVQFGLGRSLNIPTIQTKTITSTLSSTSTSGPGGGKGAGTIGSYSVVDYSLIRFHGIANEVNAKKTGFSDSDLTSLLEGLWLGTLQLNTRSKFNHSPRLLVVVKMKEKQSQLGDLDLGISLKDTEKIKSIGMAKLEIKGLVDRIVAGVAKIESISIKIESQVQLLYGGSPVTSIQDAFKIAKLPPEKIIELPLSGA